MLIEIIETMLISSVIKV